MADQSRQPTKLKSVVSAVVAIAAFAAAYVGAQLLFSKSAEKKAAELAAVLTELAQKENPSNPKVMDDGSTLVSVSASGKDIIYIFAVPPAGETDAKYGNFAREEKLKHALCTGSARSVIDAGANFIYVYLKEGTQEELGRTKIWICT